MKFLKIKIDERDWIINLENVENIYISEQIIEFTFIGGHCFEINKDINGGSEWYIRHNYEKVLNMDEVLETLRNL